MSTITKYFNKETNEFAKVLIQMTVFNEKQLALTRKVVDFVNALLNNTADEKSMLKFCNVRKVKIADFKLSDDMRERFSKLVFRRTEIYHLCVAVDDRQCAAYYLTKNKALRDRADLIDLKKIKNLSADVVVKKERKAKAKANVAVASAEVKQIEMSAEQAQSTETALATL